VTEKSKTILLDGGMGRQLARMGAPFRQPEWSALALMEAPATVADAHGQFIAAGAEVITTNSYALVPSISARNASQGRGAAGRSLRPAGAASRRRCRTPVKVAGSLPPLSAPIARICSMPPPHPGCFRC
jgi:S-methylmethionine-dependent homocysteine/selenocysteine methylase